MEFLPETCVDAVGTTGEAIKPFEGNDAVRASFDVLSGGEVALSTKAIETCELIGVDIHWVTCLEVQG